MKKRLIALIAFALFWLAFFFFARLFFILTHYREAFQFSPGTLGSTFLHGIRLDISATAYVMAIPLMASIVSVWIKGDWFRRFLRWYSWVIVFVSSALIVGDTVLYTYWGFRMDYTALSYLKNPQEAAASVTTLKIIEVCLTVTAITLLFVFLYKKLIDSLFKDQEIKSMKITSTLLFVILTGALIIPVRGGVGVAPINAGTVYFSENMFVNHTAINVVWNVGSSVFNRKPSVNPYSFFDISSSTSHCRFPDYKEGYPRKST